MIIIPTETTILGEFRSKGQIRIDGRIEGLGEIQGMIILTRSATWIGKIVADTIVVEGRVEGEIIARERLEIMSSGKISGKIVSPKISIQFGATVTGDLIMSKAETVDLMETKMRRENWKHARELESTEEAARKIVGE